MSETIPQVQAAVMNGLSKAEIEGLLERKLQPDELQAFNKAKAVLKLQAADKKQQEAAKTPFAQTAEQNRMPSLKERYTEKQVEESIVKCHGRWPLIVTDLNCSYAQLGVWMQNHKKHRDLSEKLREEIIDIAEDMMWQLLDSPDAKLRLDAAKFILKTLGKTRGWSESPQMIQQINAGDNSIDIKNIFGL